MRRDWTKIGVKTGIDRDRIESAIGSMQWREVPCEMAMGPGLAIKAAIKELRIPKVTHVADSHALAPYGFVGISGHYRNGDAKVYIVDRGSDIIPVCIDFDPKGEVIPA